MGGRRAGLGPDAVITTSANRAMAELHHRMPAILDQAATEVWLDPATSPAVGNARVDRPELILPVT